MKVTQRAFVVLATMAFLFIAHSGSAAQSAQQLPSPAQPVIQEPGKTTQSAPRPSQPLPQPTQSASPQAGTTAEGELVEVDVKDSMITIKTAAGAEMDFKYNDTTKVTGGQKGVAGLATMTGSQLMLTYKKDGATNLATAIQVRPAAATPRPSDPSLIRPDPSKPGSVK